MHLGEFKKSGEDKHTITFKHPKGHELRVLKSEPSQGIGMGKQGAMEGHPMAKGGQVQRFVNGGQALPPELSDLQGLQVASTDPQTQFGVSQAPQADQAPSPQVAQQGQGAASSQPQAEAPGNFPLQQPQAPQQSSLPITSASNLQQDINQQVGGKYAEAKALGQAGKEQAQVYSQQAQQLQNFSQGVQQKQAEIQNEMTAVGNDIKAGHIQAPPIPVNLGTILGVVLSGIGGTSGQNAAMNFLKEQQELAVKTQTAEMNKKDNLMTALMHQYGSLTDAQNAFRVIHNDQVANQVQQIAASYSDPIERAKAEQAAGVIKAPNEGIVGQLAFTQQLMRGQGGGQTQGGRISQVDPSVQARFLSPNPETQKAALGEVKQQQNLNSMNSNAMQSFNRVAQMNTVANRFENPLQSSKRIDAEWEPMMDKLTKNNEGRVTPITVDLMSSLKPALTDNQATINEKREKLMNLLNSERSTPTLDSIGVRMAKNTGVAVPNANITSGYMAQR